MKIITITLIVILLVVIRAAAKWSAWIVSNARYLDGEATKMNRNSSPATRTIDRDLNRGILSLGGKNWISVCCFFLAFLAFKSVIRLTDSKELSLLGFAFCWRLFLMVRRAPVCRVAASSEQSKAKWACRLERTRIWKAAKAIRFGLARSLNGFFWDSRSTKYPRNAASSLQISWSLWQGAKGEIWLWPLSEGFWDFCKNGAITN